MKYLFYLLRFIWELPQNILGIVIYLFNKGKIKSIRIYNGRFYFENNKFGISLGSFIFWMPLSSDAKKVFPEVMKHEFGHSIQSLYFGPLYLILIGIPSVLRVLYGNLFFTVKKKAWGNYYNGYPEKWANTLAEKHYEKITYKKI